MKVFDSMVNPILSIPIDEKSSIYVVGKTNNMTDLLQFGACVNEMFNVKRKLKISPLKTLIYILIPP